MKAYLLGLEQDFRGQATLDDCRRIGLDVEVFYGLDARRASPEEIHAIYSEESARFAIDRPLSPPEIACVWGHRQMRAKFLEESADGWAVFLEDDACLQTDALPTPIELGKLPEEPIILTLLGSPPDAIVLDELAAAPGRRYVRLLDPPDYAVAYLANRAAVALDLDSYCGRKIDSVPDWPYRWNRVAQFWALDAPVASITPMDSLLEPERVALQRAANMRIPPEWHHFLTSLVGFRLIRGARLGYSPRLVWRHDVTALVGRWRLGRNRRKRLATSKVAP